MGTREVKVGSLEPEMDGGSFQPAQESLIKYRIGPKNRVTTKKYGVWKLE